ncbi:pimeloyl-ACP methyl ester carboxylesterase [Salinibacterium sp. CAN_S4]|uniref:alpha/beta fold hydrolase n=1 Tax=Salinibacterium sp. CAN_S4 TaxID=2787727 RepID=UPI0018EF8DED
MTVGPMKVRELGDPQGETLLMLHGGTVAGWMWGPQVPAFGDYRILVPDLPGFGDSNELPWRSTAEAADALAAVLGEVPAHVVGLSLGSTVAVHLASRHPRLVSSLFLASAQVAPPRRRDVLLGRLSLVAWNQRAFWAATAKAYGLSGDDAEQLIDTGLGIDVRTARAILEEVRLGIPSDVLATVTAPTLAVAGSLDSATITGGSLDAVRDGIPGSLVATARGLHHQWNVESPDLFNAALRCWLDNGTVFSGLFPDRD